MRLLIIALTFISISVSAQEKEKKQLSPKVDTIKMRKPDLSKNKLTNPKDQERNLYKMPNAKPKDEAVYSSLKEKKRDTTDYKILNSVTPEKSKQKNK
jgi:hypothetical protein